MTLFLAGTICLEFRKREVTSFIEMKSGYQNRHRQLVQINDDRSRKRGWCITINNFTEEEKQKVKDLIENSCQYGIAEIEHQKEGTPHIQGYLYFKNARKFSQVKQLLIRAHWEEAQGTWQDNFKYCSKEDTVFAIKGHTVEDAVKYENLDEFEIMYKDMKTMVPDAFEIKYPKEWYLRRKEVERVMIDAAMLHVMDFDGDLQCKNWWIWGKPGIGKSRWAASNGEYSEIFKKNFNKWWDGYSILRTKIVIIEDYPCLPAGNALVQHMKIWGDRYPFEAECKGSHMMVEPRRFFIIVTSNYPIDACFENQEDQEAIRRRFKEYEMVEGDLLNMGDFTLDRKIIEIE